MQVMNTIGIMLVQIVFICLGKKIIPGIFLIQRFLENPCFSSAGILDDSSATLKADKFNQADKGLPGMGVIRMP